jgi:hypothetical protein
MEGAAPGRATRGFCQASDTDSRRLTFITTEPLTAVWNCVDNKTGILLTAVCVMSTAVGEYAHAAHCLKVLRGDTMGTCFTDTWPVGKDVLRVLGGMSGGRLDIFHWMKRITKMLHDAALRDGTLNGHQHTDAEIAELERSGKKQLCSATNPRR